MHGMLMKINMSSRNDHQSYLLCPDFSKIKGVKHAFLTRNLPGSSHIYTRLAYEKFGNKECSMEETIRKDRGIAKDCVKDCFGFSVKKLSILEETHSNQVVLIKDQFDETTEPEADGHVTQASGVALGILTADCVPVLLSHWKKVFA